MKRFASALLTGSLLLSAAPVFAATFQASDEDAFSISIPVNDDLYVAGGLVQVKERINGDLVIAGGEVTITGDVTEDIIGAGGRLNIEGNVGDDVRAAGGEITIRGKISGDLIVAGGQVRISEGAVIEGDAVISGGMLVIDGEINGDVKIAGGEVYFGGEIAGDTKIYVDHFQIAGTITGDTTIVAQEVTLEDGALIKGNLTYWLPGDAPDFSTVVSGTATFDPDLKHVNREVMETTFLGATTVALLALMGYSLLASALIILLLILITNTFFAKTAKHLKSSPWKCMLIGFLFFALTPIIAVLFLITVIGIPISFFIFIMYGFAIFFAKPLTAITLAKWTELKYKKKWGKTRLFFVSIGAYLLLKLLGFIPIVGWIVCILAILLAFGALLQAKWEIWKKVA